MKITVTIEDQAGRTVQHGYEARINAESKIMPAADALALLVKSTGEQAVVTYLHGPENEHDETVGLGHRVGSFPLIEDDPVLDLEVSYWNTEEMTVGTGVLVDKVRTLSTGEIGSLSIRDAIAAGRKLLLEQVQS